VVKIHFSASCQLFKQSVILINGNYELPATKETYNNSNKIYFIQQTQHGNGYIEID
jgi:hypothetical protein